MDAFPNNNEDEEEEEADKADEADKEAEEEEADEETADGKVEEEEADEEAEKEAEEEAEEEADEEKAEEEEEEDEEEEREEEREAEPPPLQLKTPPIALRLKPFKAIEDLIADVNKFTATQGYAVVKSGNKKNGRGIEQKKNLKCTHGGEYKDNVAPELRKRKRAVRTTGCKWAAYGKLVEGEWFLFLKETKHNHPLSKPEALSPLQKMRKEDLEAVTNDRR